MMEQTVQIYVEGLNIEKIKADPQMEQFFDEFNDKVVRVADKKLATLCRKFEKKAKLKVVVTFEESKE
jgi:ribosomal protein L24